MPQFRTLVLDYDGVIGYQDKELEAAAIDLLIEAIKRAHKSNVVIHLNSMRGQSLFKQCAIDRLLTGLSNNMKVYFSGAAGNFSLNLRTRNTLQTTSYLTQSVIDKLVDSQAVAKVLAMNQQNDYDAWSKYQNWASFPIAQLQNRKELYWDFGFEGSLGIVKCAIDVYPEYNKIYEELESELQAYKGVNYYITDSVMEIVASTNDKGTIVQDFYNKGYYPAGDILAIGDNPQGVDGPMLNALPKQLANEEFKGISNSGANELEKFRKFKIICDSLWS